MSTNDIKHYVKIIIEKFYEGSSIDNAYDYLTRMNLSKSKTKNIIELAEIEFEQKVGYKIKKSILGQLDKYSEKELSNIHYELFKKLKSKQLKYIEYENTVKIKALVSQNKSEAEIIALMDTNQMNVDSIKKLIKKERKTIKKKVKGEQIGYFIFGTLVLIVGLALTASQPRGGIGIIIIAVTALGKAFTYDGNISNMQ